MQRHWRAGGSAEWGVPQGAGRPGKARAQPRGWGALRGGGVQRRLRWAWALGGREGKPGPSATAPPTGRPAPCASSPDSSSEGAGPGPTRPALSLSADLDLVRVVLEPSESARTPGPLHNLLQASLPGQVLWVPPHSPALMSPKRDSTRTGSLFHTGTVLYISRGLSYLLKRQRSEDGLAVEPVSQGDPCGHRGAPRGRHLGHRGPTPHVKTLPTTGCPSGEGQAGDRSPPESGGQSHPGRERGLVCHREGPASEHQDPHSCGVHPFLSFLTAALVVAKPPGTPKSCRQEALTAEPRATAWHAGLERPR